MDDLDDFVVEVEILSSREGPRDGNFRFEGRPLRLGGVGAGTTSKISIHPSLALLESRSGDSRSFLALRYRAAAAANSL